MAKVDELLKLAQDCCTQARITVDLAAKGALIRMADEYLKQAQELKGDRRVIQAVFPKSDRKIGQDQ